MLYKLLLKPVFFLFPPETIHHIVFRLLKFFSAIPGISQVTRAVYVVKGDVSIGNDAVPPHTMAVIARGEAPTLTFGAGASAMLIGGEPVGPRLIWWNFVAPSQERLARAKADWREGRFPRIPEETEFIPLPEG